MLVSHNVLFRSFFLSLFHHPFVCFDLNRFQRDILFQVIFHHFFNSFMKDFGQQALTGGCYSLEFETRARFSTPTFVIGKTKLWSKCIFADLDDRMPH